MRGRVLVVGLVLAGSLGACASSAGDPPEPVQVEAPVTTAATANVENEAEESGPGLNTPSLDEIGLSIPADCPTPWLPVYAQDEQLYPVSVPPTEERPAEGTPIDLGSRRYVLPDTDGDGSADEQLEGVDGGNAYAVRRGDGDLVLAADGAVVGSAGGASWVGDLDGDGRDEVMVFVADGSAQAGYPLYVVPGTTPVGRRDPRVVGARLPATTGTIVGPAGDVDGDGNDDLLLPGPDRTLSVIDGAVVLDSVGAELDADTTPLMSLPDDVRSTVLLGDARPVSIRVMSVDGDPDATELMLMTQPPIRLRTDRVPLAAEEALFAPITTSITGFENETGRYVQLQSATTRSGNQTVLIWNLDDPCAEPTPTG